MSPIDWLRGKAKQKAATASYLDQINAPLPVATLEALRTELASANPARYRRPMPAEPQPVAVIAIDGTVTEQQAQQFRESIQVLGRSRAQRSSESLGCPCAVIYSVCTCAGTNISARTKAADFHVEQR